MLNEQAFLETIFEQPEDDGPRLVYADWLEEHGQTARAELIRVQIELPRATPRSRERTALAKREKALLAEHKADWFPEFEGWKASHYAVRRGFVDAIEVRGQLFLDKLEEQFRRQPIYDVNLTAVNRDMVLQVARMPRLTRLRHLGLPQADIDLAVLREFLASPFLDRLTLLHIPLNAVGSAGLELIAGSPSLANLRHLNVKHNHIGPEGVQALARSAELSNLQWLNLCGNHHRPSDVVDLLRSIHRTQLRYLDLWSTNLRDAGLRRLVECPDIARLTGLNLNNNEFSPRGIQALLKCNYLTRLEELHLGWSPVTPPIAEALLNSPRFPRLKRLNLHACGAIEPDQQRALKRHFKARVTFQTPPIPR